MVGEYINSVITNILYKLMDLTFSLFHAIKQYVVLLYHFIDSISINRTSMNRTNSIPYKLILKHNFNYIGN